MKNSAINLEGKRFGRLVFLERDRDYQGKNIRYICLCDCGKTKSVCPYHVMNGNIRSCGCLRSEVMSRLVSERTTTHGMSGTALYAVYRSMINRCYLEKSISYHNYGERGITVCDRWLESFQNFYDDMGDRPNRGYQLERKNNDLGYSPENCIWVTRSKNMMNRRNTERLTCNGMTKTTIEWAEENETSVQTIRARLRRGWSVEKALTVPIKKRTKGE